MQSTHNWHIQATRPIITPRQLADLLPLTPEVTKTVIAGRHAVQNILDRKDHRLLVVVGPCSIHDPVAAVDYARHLLPLRQEFADRMEIVMRVYFEKPRTILGWKGLINDPHLDGSCDIETGLKVGRKLLSDIVGLGMPAGTEFLDPVVPQYLADLVSWAAVGARTTESQTHREMASGLSMPVGFKNGTDGMLETAVNAMKAARHAHSFLGIDPDGRTCIVQTTGNQWGHVVLRGGKHAPNYDERSIADAVKQLHEAGLPGALIVDCSHANSGKKHTRQQTVWQHLIEQRVAGSQSIIGVMLESNLEEGSQPLVDDLKQLRYGVSITDACLGWKDTEALLRKGYEALR
ncbi:MAG: 3-deoxy-7-phosphoheptulonate synthase [Proteobacteria bacterium]|nr:3-deoxy-7-phosphoheptulonate synthase [Pseudomonadota bacterium]